jgi:hypothetical protein
MSVPSEEPIISQGSEEVVDNSQGQQQEEAGTGINPAWNEMLSGLPSSLHSTVIPHLKEWDKNYQEGIGKVHSQYEPFKEYLDQGVEPDQINYALQVLEAIQSRPQDVFQAMQQYFTPEEQQQQQQTGEEPNLEEQGQTSEPIDITQHPQFQQLAQMVNAMAELTVQQNSQQTQQQEDDALEQEFTAAREQFKDKGDFDEKFVMTQLIADAEFGEGKLTVAEAAQQYYDFVDSVRANANRPGPPKILSGAGSSANTAPTTSQLGDKDRRSLVANMLAASQQD